MNYIRHLNGFFARSATDSRLLSTHISLYMALFQHWNYNRFEDSFTVFRHDIMRMSKLGSKNTYSRCIRQLHAAGYIRYYPGLNRGLPARVNIRRLDLLIDAGGEAQGTLFTGNDAHPSCTEKEPAPVPEVTDGSTETGTGVVPEPVHIIKHINSKQVNSVLNTPTKNQLHHEEKTTTKNGPGPESKLVPGIMAPTQALPAAGEKQKKPGPPYLQVECFFLENTYPKKEALKFWLYNEGRGWQLAEGQPIHQWQPLAHKWMLGTGPGKGTGNAKNLFIDNDKNYDAPL
jgi:hypothetical protein